MQRRMNHVFLMVLALVHVLLVGSAHSAELSSTDDINFTLVDAATDEDLFELADEATINLAETGQELNIRVDIQMPVEEVWFEVDGTFFGTEKKAPYALAGDEAGDYQSWTPAAGSHTLQATAYDAVGGEIVRKTVHFTVAESAEDNIDSSDYIFFTLVDAITDEDIYELADEATINLAETGQELNIRVDTQMPVEEVWFEVDGTFFGTEKKAPYALAGDEAGDYQSWTPAAGSHTLQATAYDAIGDEIARKAIHFVVVESEDQPASQFNKDTDLISLHYDHCADPNDGHATVADRTVTAYYDITPHIVSGAYGWQMDDPGNNISYQPGSEEVSWAAWDNDWLNAHEDRAGSVEKTAETWSATIDKGGHIWISEVGQSDFTGEVVRLLHQTYDQQTTKNKIHLVQHSDWNEYYTTPESLDYVKQHTDYIKIDTGNRGDNVTEALMLLYNSQNATVINDFMQKAIQSENGEAWKAAFKYLDPLTDQGWPEGQKLDLSGTVGLLQILGIDTQTVSGCSDFASFFFKGGSERPVVESYIASPEEADPGKRPVIESFTATPWKLGPGQESILQWTTQDADYVLLDPASTEEDLPANGQLAVTPEKSTIYSLSAFNDKGRVTHHLSVEIDPHQDPDDLDNDGLDDTWEQNQFGSLAQEADDDFDGDGLTNVDEYLAGLDPATPTIYVKTGEEIQAAINNAEEGDTVLVGPGRMNIPEKPIEFHGKAITLKSIKGPEETILESNGNTIFFFGNNESRETKVDGFTLTGSYDSTVIISAVTIEDTSPTISNCIFQNNAYPSGTLNPTVGMECNAIRIAGGTPLITNSYFREGSNRFPGPDQCGGIVIEQEAEATIINSVFDNIKKGALKTINSTASIINCTLVRAGWKEWSNGPIISNTGATINFTNSIIRETYTAQDALIFTDGGTITFHYSNVHGSGGSANWNTALGVDGGGNIDVDPKFESQSDLHLTDSSPCIGKGTIEGAPNDDIDGDSRPKKDGVDMGADEVVLPVAPPVFEYVYASPATIDLSQFSTLRWHITGAENVTMEPVVGFGDNSVVTKGSVNLSPEKTTTYTLTASNSFGAVSRTITIHVDVTAPFIEVFSKRKPFTYPCVYEQLHWKTHNVDSIRIEALVDNADPIDVCASKHKEGTPKHRLYAQKGYCGVEPKQTTTYRLYAKSGSWKGEKELTVTVNGTEDTDGDGKVDGDEYCECTDVNNPDTDNDGIPDGSDTNTDRRCHLDTDGDGIPNQWEAYAGMDPLKNDANEDLDHDSFSNLEEYLAGTSALHNEDYPFIHHIKYDANGNMQESLRREKPTIAVD